MWEKFKKYISNKWYHDKIHVLIWTYLILHFVYLNFCPHILGSQIDREYLKNIDTEIITSIYTAEASEHLIDEETGTITAYFGKKFDDSSVKVSIDIHTENIYKSKADIYVYWHPYKRLFNFDTVIAVQKNNVQIKILEDTSKIRSTYGQQYLKEILSEIGL